MLYREVKGLVQERPIGGFLESESLRTVAYVHVYVCDLVYVHIYMNELVVRI